MLVRRSDLHGDILTFCCCFESLFVGYCLELLVTSTLGFKAGWIHRSSASSPVRKGLLRFTSSVTPADYLTVSIATETF